MKYSHEPVLVTEFLKFFEGKHLHTFFDGTLGSGGHAKAILESHSEITTYIGCDQDTDALALAKENLLPWKEKVLFVNDNFANIEKVLEENNIDAVDGILFDIGVSSMQLDDSTRGFSFRFDSLLDMRMDASNDIDAKQVVNTFSEKKLGEIFKKWGEEPQWKKAARAIIERRRKKPITTTKDLAELLTRVLKRKRKIHPATLVFQGLRIFVNNEIEVLEKGITAAISMLQENGRLGVMSYHSLEDRLVKHTFRDTAKKEVVQVLTKKPVIPTREEMRKNPRSRSAKMRVVEKL
jgi:16S rRNA (cytosine1402-N4)-methyltransferase